MSWGGSGPFFQVYPTPAQVVDLHGSRWQLISARYFPAHSGAFLHKWLDYMAEREVDPVAAEPPQRSMHLTSHQNSRASNSVGGSSLLDVPGDGVWGPPIPLPAAPCAPSPDPLASPQLLPPRSPQEERHHQPSLHNGGRTHDLSSHPEAAMVLPTLPLVSLSLSLSLSLSCSLSPSLSLHSCPCLSFVPVCPEMMNG